MRETTITSFPPTGAGQVARHVTVALDGPLDRTSVPRLEACLAGLRGVGCRSIVIDLGRVPFVNAAGVAVLFHAAKTARLGGGEVVLHHANHRLVQLLEMTNLAAVFGGARSVGQVA